MANVNRIGCLAANYADVGDFLVVYIEEAHPADGWSFEGNKHDIRSHRSVDERIRAASKLVSVDRRFPVVVDAMTDEANRAYGGLFERLYIIQNSTVVYQGQRGPAGFRVGEVEKWLNDYRLLTSQAASAPAVSVANVTSASNPC